MSSNPTPEPIEAPIGSGPVQVDPFTDDERNILIIGRETKADINYRVKEAAFFTEYISYISGIPLGGKKGKSSHTPVFIALSLLVRRVAFGPFKGNS